MKSKRRVILALSIFLVVFLVGVAGYWYFGGGPQFSNTPRWSLLDCVYMTIITIGTIGYGEVHGPLNDAARIFTSIYIIVCLVTIAYAMSSITAFIVEGELKNILGRRKMDKAIRQLKDHFIVCGSDETAETVIHELLLTKKKFVVVANCKEDAEALPALGEFPYLQGDPTDDDVLIKSGIERAKGILLSLATDEANLFATISARSLNAQIRIVTKALDVRSHKKIFKAGADSVISPTFIGGMRMVSEMIRPAATTFLDLMLRERERVLRVDEITLPPGSPLDGRPIAEACIGEKTGALLVAVRPGGRKDFAFNPKPDTVLHEGDILVFIASPDMAQELAALAGTA